MNIISTLLFALFLPTLVGAFPGEYKGFGPLSIEKHLEETGETSSLKTMCDVSANILDSESEFHFRWGSVVCANIAFNDSSPLIKKVGSKLFYENKGKTYEVGKVTPDGTLEFQIFHPPQSATVTEYISGTGCLNEGVRQKTIYLYSSSDFKFKKESDASWTMTVTHNTDSLARYYKREHFCTYDMVSRLTEKKSYTATVK